MRNGRLQSGQVGERMAEAFFLNNGWVMSRSQPPITILGMISPAMAYALKRFIPRLATFGHMIIGRMGKGGISDYTGYYKNTVQKWSDGKRAWVDSGDGFIPTYRACEVKECNGDTMPASRLDKDQRAFFSALPSGCAWVGIFWQDTGKFSMHAFIDKGSYKRPEAP